jgi:mRNA-degrading endonuclease RelE of RelBE toxin-antitoxin system
MRRSAELLDIARTDRRQADRIHRAVQTLGRTEQGDIHKLAGTTDDWRLRVGDWRVLFNVDRVSQHLTVMSIRRRNEGTYRD